MSIQAVAFDVDGTLYPNDIMYRKSVGFALRHARLLIGYSRVRKSIRKIRPIEDFRSIQASLLAEELSIGKADAGALLESVIYDEWEEILKGVPVFPHLQDMLSDLKERGVPLGVLSDFPVARKLSYLGLGDDWSCAFSAEEVGYLKPNPEPFIRLAECLGIEPSAIVYVGNSYRYDVVGAKAAGMVAAHLSKKAEAGTQPGTHADFTFSDYRTFHAWLLDRLV